MAYSRCSSKTRTTRRDLGAGIGDVEVDAVGPDVLAYTEMVRLIARKTGARAKLVHVPSWAAMTGAWLAGLLVRDVC